MAGLLATTRAKEDRAADVEDLIKVHQIGIGLASLPAAADLFEFLAASLKSLTGAAVVTVGEYRPAHRDIVLRRLDSDRAALALARRVFGFDAREIITKLDERTYELIVASRVGIFGSLSEVSFGAIAPSIGGFLQRLLGFTTFVGLAYVFEGTLYGTSVLAFPKGVAPPPTIVLDAFASLAAVSLRRQEAERRLRLSDERLAGIARNLPGVVFQFYARKNGEMGLHYVSESGERVFGFPVAPLADAFPRFVEWVVPEDRPSFVASVEHAVKERCRWEFECRVRRPSGEVLWVKGVSQPTQVGDDLVFDGLVLDITERRRAEEALREHQGMVDAIIETSQDWVWAMDASGRHTFSNPAVERILGFRPEEIVGLGLDLLHDEDRPRIELVFRDAVASGRGWSNVTARWGCQDGGYRVLESNAVPIVGPDGRLAGFRGVDRDITERMRSAEELAEWKRRYDRLSLAAGNIVYDCSSVGGGMIWGGAVETLLGYSPSELRGGFDQWASLIHPDDRERTLGQYQVAEAACRVFQAEYRMLCKDGRFVLIEDTGYPLADASGCAERYVGVMADVTERRKADAERQRLKEQLEQSQKMESLGRLAGGVAHDFNNLLTVINGYTDLMLQDLRPADPLREGLDQVRKAGTRAASLTQQLLAFGRRQVLQPRPLNLDQVVGDMQPMLRRLLGEDVAVSATLGAPRAIVLADRHQIEQVIMNLVVNSRDAMPRGGTLAIETAVVESGALSTPDNSAPNGWVRLNLTDTGVGMDEETRQRAFEPFFTTKPPGKGTGLGLSMVQGLVAQSGGAIDVKSVRGQGSTFRIFLPVVEEQLALGFPSADLPPRRSGGETILVVEDEPDVRNYAAAALRAYGYRVVTAENAGEALLVGERRQDPIDVLVTDVVMPNMGGRELSDQLRGRRPELKVLFMSGYTDDVVVHHGVHQQDAGFIQKPFSPDELANKVHEVLSRPVRERGGRRG